MVRIVYGVSGEGSGHSSRARVVASHLIERGHEVRLVSYDRGHRNLKDDFDVFETEGLTIATADNRVSVVRTFTENLARLSTGVRRLKALRRELFEDFSPEVVLTDFEPMTAYLANHFDRPLVSIDNQHRMRYMDYPCPRELRKDAFLAETVIRMMVPRPDVSLVTTFWFGEVKNGRTFLFPPLLRREVRDLVPTDGDHVLVYATKGFDALLAALSARTEQEFRVYGFEREDREGHMAFRPHSVEGFLADLASSRAVVATAGFTLITEALHLGKPYLALPMKGQFEQELNALLLESSGRGRNGRDFHPDALATFLDEVGATRSAHGDPGVGDPDALLVFLDELLADAAARAREFHSRRRG